MPGVMAALAGTSSSNQGDKRGLLPRGPPSSSLLFLLPPYWNSQMSKAQGHSMLGMRSRAFTEHWSRVKVGTDLTHSWTVRAKKSCA